MSDNSHHIIPLLNRDRVDRIRTIIKGNLANYFHKKIDCDVIQETSDAICNEVINFILEDSMPLNFGPRTFYSTEEDEHKICSLCDVEFHALDGKEYSDRDYCDACFRVKMNKLGRCENCTNKKRGAHKDHRFCIDCSNE